MLSHRQHLDVGEALRQNVIGELIGQFDVAQARPPRPEMDLVGAHRFEDRVGGGAVGHPFVVVPPVVRDEHPRAGAGRDFGGEGHRIGPVGDRPVDAVHPELVQAVDGEARPEKLPHAGGTQHPHRGVIAVPTVELADQADALGVGGPHREGHPVDHAVRGGERTGLGAKDFPEPFVAALGEQVQIHFAECRQETVGVGGDQRAARVSHLQAVVDQVGERQGHREDTRPDMLHRVSDPADQCRHRLGVRAQCPDDGVFAVLVRPEDAVRVVVHPGHQSGKFGRVGCQVGVRGVPGHRVTPGAVGWPADPLGSPACSGCGRRPEPGPGARSWIAPTGIPPR